MAKMYIPKAQKKKSTVAPKEPWSIEYVASSEKWIMYGANGEVVGDRSLQDDAKKDIKIKKLAWGESESQRIFDETPKEPWSIQYSPSLKKWIMYGANSEIIGDRTSHEDAKNDVNSKEQAWDQSETKRISDEASAQGQAMSQGSLDDSLARTRENQAKTKAFSSIYSALREIERVTGRDQADIVREWYADPTKMPEDLKGIVIDRDLFNNLMDIVEVKGDRFSEIKATKQEERFEPLLEQKERQAAAGQRISNELERVVGYRPQAQEGTSIDTPTAPNVLDPEPEQPTVPAAFQEPTQLGQSLMPPEAQEQPPSEGSPLAPPAQPPPQQAQQMPQQQGQPFIPSYGETFQGLGSDPSMSPDQIRRLTLEKDMDLAKRGGQQQAETLSGMMPKSVEDVGMDWGGKPTYAAAKSIWEKDFAEPGYEYASDKPYNLREHQLAMAGHGPGSSSLRMNEKGKAEAQTKEKLENLMRIQDMLGKGYQSQGDSIDYINKLSAATREASISPSERGQEAIGRSLERERGEGYRQDVLSKDLAEAETQLRNAEFSEDLQEEKFLQGIRQNQAQQAANLSNQLTAFADLEDNFKQLKAEDLKRHSNLKDSLWQNRAQIYMMLERSGREEEALELKAEETDQAKWMKAAALIGKAALSAGLVATGNPAAAAMVWAPEVAQLGASAFGKSASSGSTATPPSAVGSGATGATGAAGGLKPQGQTFNQPSYYGATP